MERKIGEIFTYKGKTYQVVKYTTCIDCAFGERICSLLKSYIGHCTSNKRSDKTSVIFKLISNMENNQLTIDIPEGMEIDLENSNLAKGIVKFKKHDITYENIEDALKLGKNCKSIIINESNASKLVTLSKLMNIAKYYNGDWKYKVNGGERGYMIAYDNSIKELPYYKVNVINPTTDVYYGNPIFENDVDAQAVIDNPNFRDILDAIYKN